MKAIALAQAYVNLDRLAFLQLLGTPDLRNCYDALKKQLRERNAWNEFEELCVAGAEAEELLWILLGCQGFPGLYSTEQLFGLTADQLKDELAVIEQAASIIEKTSSHSFGLLFSAVIGWSFSENLRAYANFARAAQRDFSHGTEWFLNIAKARLVIHVTHKAKDRRFHDWEVSVLISAMTGGAYDVGAQKRWRAKHLDLTKDAKLDPYTTQTAEERERSHVMLKEALDENPAFRETVAQMTSSYLNLLQSRQ